MTAAEFKRKWGRFTGKDTSAYQQHSDGPAPARIGGVEKGINHGFRGFHGWERDGDPHPDPPIRWEREKIKWRLNLVPA